METTAPRIGFLADAAAPISEPPALPVAQPYAQSNAGIHAIPAKPTPRRRRLDRQSGQAIEILGHAIQYLADEFALECMDPACHNTDAPEPRLQAIELMMAANREIYMSCPVVPTLPERLRSFLRRSTDFRN